MSEAMKEAWKEDPIKMLGFLISAIRCGDEFGEPHETAASVIRAALSGAQQGESDDGLSLCTNMDEVRSSARKVTGYADPGTRHPAQVPEGWRVDAEVAIRNAQSDVFRGDREEYYETMMLLFARRILSLTAAPSGDAKREAEIKAEALEEFADDMKAKSDSAMTVQHATIIDWAEDYARTAAARLRQSDSGDSDGGEL